MENKIYTHIFNDIYSKVLQLSENPSQFAEYLSLQIRELIGTRTVIIVIKAETGKSEIFSVYPARRKEWANQGSIHKLSDLSFGFESVRYLNDDNKKEKTAILLNELGVEKAISIPLIAANRVIGSILLLDIMDLFGIESVIDLLNRLSGVFALIVRNAYLYHNMENLVTIRTQELKEQNEELVKSETQLKAINEEHQILNEELIDNIRKTEEINQQLSEAKKRLEESEEDLLISQKVAKIGHWKLNTNTMQVSGSPGLYTIFNLNINNKLELDDFVSKLYPNDKEYVLSHIKKAIEYGRAYNIQYRILLGKKQIKWIKAIGNAKLDNDGKVVEVSGIVQDITQHKNDEIELKNAKEKAEESDRLKSAFLANMSHEIRTPMNGILGFTNLLKEGDLSGEKRDKFIGIIRKSGDRMLNTVNDIIDISKIDAGQVELLKVVVNINEEIDNQFEFFIEEASLKGIELRLVNNLPKHSAIVTDEQKLVSITSNLIKNAIKYTDKGSIEVCCNKKGSELEFIVADTGIGISKNRIQSIFNRFEQADINDIHARQGSGLGLSIAKAYIEMLGGNIGVESEVGMGSTFYFTLPWIEKQVVPEKTHVREVIDDRTNDRQINVLIAEDDDISFEHLEIVLNPMAGNLTRVVNGQEAIDFMKNNSDVDVILMDIKMPVMDGYTTTKEIRKFNKDVIIIAQTAYALEGDKEKALSVGCNDYITKPINIKLLLELINLNK